MRACARCAADIQRRHANSRYCGPCGVLATFTSMACSRAVGRAVKNAQLPAAKTLKCVDCGKPALVYDHRDYSKPLAVDAVCGRCNVVRGPAVWATPAEPAQQGA
jgi:ribosomal protein S27AE